MYCIVAEVQCAGVTDTYIAAASEHVGRATQMAATDSEDSSMHASTKCRHLQTLDTQEASTVERWSE